MKSFSSMIDRSSRPAIWQRWASMSLTPGVLAQRLQEKGADGRRSDFGKHVIPAMMAAGDRVISEPAIASMSAP